MSTPFPMPEHIDMHDYLARVEKVVRDNLHRGARVIALKERDATERTDYWERTYMVAWTFPDSEPRKSGTHQVNINSNGEAALFFGHYFDGDTGDNALIDWEKR
jgi:hypothetical protein